MAFLLTKVSIVSLLTVSCFTASAQQLENNASQIITKNGSQSSIKGPTQNFTGNVRIDPLFTTDSHASVSGAYVTFEPGARSAWHIHPAGQTLIVTSGAGYTQQWGGPIVKIYSGDVISCPAGVKHWHGATEKNAMTHISVVEAINGQNVEWMEKVTDKQYQGLE